MVEYEQAMNVNFPGGRQLSCWSVLRYSSRTEVDPLVLPVASNATCATFENEAASYARLPFARRDASAYFLKADTKGNIGG
jgi:hypothetical protein